MKRTDLLNAIDELKGTEDIQHAIDCLFTLCNEFCDDYETEFNNIKDSLEDLAPHIDKVGEAHKCAEKCGSDLY